MTRLSFRVAAFLMMVPFVGVGEGSVRNASPMPRCDSRDGRIAVPAGILLSGEDGQEQPGRRIDVAAFWIDRHEVSNRQFAAFVAATGYQTRAERDGASALFVPPDRAISLNDASRWWRLVEGADWRHPQGPKSNLIARDDEPVVHVDREDALAFARWAGGALPTEMQWERAARGPQDSPREPLSWAYASNGVARANIWEGAFPVHDIGSDGFKGVAPAGCFRANGWGADDMVGNVWEWVAGEGPKGLVKGGSYLCAKNYCANFRPAAFQAQEQDLATSHIGFRLVYDRPG